MPSSFELIMQHSIILLGYMGSGKSALGKQLAKALNCSFIDLDDYIVANENSDIPELFNKYGELYFRKLEHKSLKLLLSQKKPVVIGLGGGTPCYYDNMDMILKASSFISIYLKTSIGTLTECLMPQRDQRPLIYHISQESEMQEFIGKHLFERAPFYQKAQISIQTDNKSLPVLTDEILKILA